MSLDTLIADTRKAITDDAANAHAVFTAQGTLVGITVPVSRTLVTSGYLASGG
jgi:hypothetical protein